ncbi:hypothetical protein ABDJ41_10775 [Pedobacter sp. ASV1-7]|uniref:hypothetical protein n=1 Tax=Pedobacter sp. ASV1-7 TaxID=3145237 RepID=UPI0032E9110B
MKLTQVLLSLNNSFAFAVFLGGPCIANATSAQEKPLVKSIDSVGRQAIKSVVENKKNDFKNKIKEQTSQFTDTAKRKSAVQTYSSKQLVDLRSRKQGIFKIIII